MEIVMSADEVRTDLAMAHTEPNIFNAGYARHPLAERSLLNAVPVIGIAHADPAASDFVTVFLGPNAQSHCDKFQAELQECWQWEGPVTHHPLSEQAWDPLLVKAFMVFLMAESFHPSIRHVLQRAKLYGVTTVVITHDPATFPADFKPFIGVADGLSFSGALRSLIGGAVSPGLICTDLADIRRCMRQSRRLIQHMGAAPAANQLHLAAEQALNHFNIQDADVARANSVLVWISAGDDLVMDDYQQVLMAVDGRVSEDCQVIVAINIEPVTSGEAKVVVTAGWA
jgi:hypothetical protein